MSSKKIHLTLVGKPAPVASSNVTPLPVARPEHDARVLVELVDGGAAVVLVIDGESFRVATLTGGPPSRPEVLARVARQYGEQALVELLEEDQQAAPVGVAGHLTPGQRDMVGADVLPMFEKLLAPKKAHGQTAPGKRQTHEADPPQASKRAPQARDMAAKAVGGSETGVLSEVDHG